MMRSWYSKRGDIIVGSHKVEHHLVVDSRTGQQKWWVIIESCSAKDLFLHCKQYGHVVDSLSNNKDRKVGSWYSVFLHLANDACVPDGRSPVGGKVGGVPFKLWDSKDESFKVKFRGKSSLGDRAIKCSGERTIYSMKEKVEKVQELNLEYLSGERKIKRISPTGFTPEVDQLKVMTMGDFAEKGGSILNFMEEVVKVGQTMGYNMEGFMGKLRNSLMFAYVFGVNIRPNCEVIRTFSRRGAETFVLSEIDKGMGSSEVVLMIGVIYQDHRFKKIKLRKFLQKAKIQMGYSREMRTVNFFTRILNKIAQQFRYRGGSWQLVCGLMIGKVKDEYFNAILERFDKPLLIVLCYRILLILFLHEQIRGSGTRYKLKKSVNERCEDCGVVKSPGYIWDSPLYFNRLFGSMIEDEWFGLWQYFFINGDILWL
ncbi:hypothetical protein Tco_0321902 [Tanacetum coccineum]